MPSEFLHRVLNGQIYTTPDGMSLSGTMLKTFSRPCIYAWKNEKEWLYVGKSTRGLFRLFTHTSEKYGSGIKQAPLEEDHIFVWFFPDITEEELTDLERVVILILKPVYNMSTPKPKVYFKEFLEKQT